MSDWVLPLSKLVDVPVTADPHADVAQALRQVLEWPNPHGTIEAEYLPPWLAQQARAALKRQSLTPPVPAEPSELRAVVAFCPDCTIERADYEGPNGAHLPTCPNCGSDQAPEPSSVPAAQPIDVKAWAEAIRAELSRWGGTKPGDSRTQGDIIADELHRLIEGSDGK